MGKRSRLILITLALGCILIVYQNLFSPSLLISNDLPYFSQLSFSWLHLLPKAWDAQRSAGMGGIYTPFLWYFFVVNLPSILLSNVLNIPWEVTERIVLFFPFLILGGGCAFLYVYTKTKQIPSALLGSVVMLLNSYVLMLASGGQMQILLGVSLIPLLLLLFEIYMEKHYLPERLSALMFGGVLSIVCMYDIRIAFLAGLIMGVRAISFLIQYPKHLVRLGILMGVSLTTLVCFHFFWILPTLLHQTNPIQDLGPAFSSVASVKFLSFATYEYPFALLHPLWPDNIFGQVPFFSPLFLLIPLLAFFPFVFLPKKHLYTYSFLFASLLVVLGAFLAKGASEPFGSIYVWLFTHVPGFELFRDSTKFYAFIIVGYSILIPLGYELLIKRWNIQGKWQGVLFAVYVIGFIAPLIPGLTKGLPGTFIYRSYPQEYQNLLTRLESDKEFSRVLWFPQVTPFSPFSSTHPGISATEYFNIYTFSSLQKQIMKPGLDTLLAKNSVKYVVLPSDVDRTLYTSDRKYDARVYSQLRQTLDSLPYLKKVKEDGDLILYETQSFLPHVSLASKREVSVREEAFWQYQIAIPQHDQTDTLLFSEAYAPGWELREKETNRVVMAQKNGSIMQFPLKELKGKQLILFYTPERWVLVGTVITLISLGTYITLIGYELLRLKRRTHA